VANKANGIDVDKFDYFMRDAHNLGIVRLFTTSVHRTYCTFCKVLVCVCDRPCRSTRTG
jgi:HD superfamily phosphohydrolase